MGGGGKERYYVGLNNVSLTWDIVPFEYAAVNRRRSKRFNWFFPLCASIYSLVLTKGLLLVIQLTPLI